ncbi:MAG: hypothetical protein K2Y29_05845 [Beijerinckiaceae bacterium]|nr:hypothetical protein [Beijerinckiaceae bacterium]
MLGAFARCMVAAVALGVAGEASAQEMPWGDIPSRGAHNIVLLAAGSVLDTQAWIIAEGLSQRWGQSVLVENIAVSGGYARTKRFARIAAYTSERADIRLLPATKLGCMG